MIKEVDCNGDGEITFEEFKKYVKKFSAAEVAMKCIWTITC